MSARAAQIPRQRQAPMKTPISENVPTRCDLSSGQTKDLRLRHQGPGQQHDLDR
jgi:hypothetical protein